MSTNLLSASTSHQPFSSSAGPSSSSSHAAQQPGFASIATSQKPELSFAPFQDLCQDFLAKLDAFVLRGKGEILERKERREQEREKEAKEKRRLEDEIVGAGSKESRLLQGEYMRYIRREGSLGGMRAKGREGGGERRAQADLCFCSQFFGFHSP